MSPCRTSRTPRSRHSCSAARRACAPRVWRQRCARGRDGGLMTGGRQVGRDGGHLRHPSDDLATRCRRRGAPLVAAQRQRHRCSHQSPRALPVSAEPARFRRGAARQRAGAHVAAWTRGLSHAVSLRMPGGCCAQLHPCAGRQNQARRSGTVTHATLDVNRARGELSKHNRAAHSSFIKCG